MGTSGPTAAPSWPIAATVAGSDSGGGAGIQADLKTFSALGVHGTSVLTALTAQNTWGVRAVHALPPEFVLAQFAALQDDLPPAAVKTGMLFDRVRIAVVAEALRRHRWPQLVVDPVMVAKGGDRLLEADAITALCEQLLPLALVVTPNWPEAAVLANQPVTDPASALAAGRRILAMGPRIVVVKGGHADGPPTDLVIEAGAVTTLPGERIPTRHTHGTGCTFSAAITAHLARGRPPLEAIREAKRYVTAAIANAPGLGGGHGPLQHLPPGWPEAGPAPRGPR